MDKTDGRSDREKPHDGDRAISDITVLYVDTDPDVWHTLSSFVDGIEDVAIERAKDVAIARDIHEQGGIDVVVVGSDMLSGPEDPLLTGSTPAVLYTATDPWEIDDEVLEIGRAHV